MVKLYGFCLSIAYIARRCHPYIESLLILIYIYTTAFAPSTSSSSVTNRLNLCEASSKITNPLWNSVVLHYVHCSPSAGALRRPQRSAYTENGVNNNTITCNEVLRGRDGRDGRDGVRGPRGPQGQGGEQGVAGPPGPRNGGVVYTRWGKTSCTNITGTELVYAGRAGGSWWSQPHWRRCQLPLHA